MRILKYFGSNFITNRQVSFEDLIIDGLMCSNGEYFILNEDELLMPCMNLRMAVFTNLFKLGCHPMPHQAKLKSYPQNKKRYTYRKKFMRKDGVFNESYYFK